MRSLRCGGRFSGFLGAAFTGGISLTASLGFGFSELAALARTGALAPLRPRLDPALTRILLAMFQGLQLTAHFHNGLLYLSKLIARIAFLFLHILDIIKPHRFKFIAQRCNRFL